MLREISLHVETVSFTDDRVWCSLIGCNNKSGWCKIETLHPTKVYGRVVGRAYSVREVARAKYSLHFVHQSAVAVAVGWGDRIYHVYFARLSHVLQVLNFFPPPFFLVGGGRRMSLKQLVRTIPRRPESSCLLRNYSADKIFGNNLHLRFVSRCFVPLRSVCCAPVYSRHPAVHCSTPGKFMTLWWVSHVYFMLHQPSPVAADPKKKPALLAISSPSYSQLSAKSWGR